MSRLVAALILCLASPLHAIEITFSPALDPNTAVISGITPGAQVVWFGFGFRPLGYESQLERTTVILTDDDRDGAIIYAPEKAIPVASVWAAIELGSGEYGTGVPKNSPARVLDLAADTFRGDAGQAQRLVRHASFSELLLIRPSNGIWTLTAGDGAVGDSDGAADGRMTNDLRTFQAFEESPPPPNRLEHGDLVFVVDPYALQLSVATFEPGR